MSGYINPVKRQMDRGNVSYYSKERLPRSVTYENSANGYASRMAAFGFLVGSGLTSVGFLLSYLLLANDYPWLVVSLTAILSGLVIAGTVGLLSLPEGREKFFQLMQEREEFEFDSTPEQGKQREFAEYNGQPLAKQLHDVRIEHDGDFFILTGRNRNKLHQWYRKGHITIRRDRSPDGKSFSELPDKIGSNAYQLARKVLLGRGLINENNEWTEAGVALLEAE